MAQKTKLNFPLWCFDANTGKRVEKIGSDEESRQKTILSNGELCASKWVRIILHNAYDYLNEILLQFFKSQVRSCGIRTLMIYIRNKGLLKILKNDS